MADSRPQECTHVVWRVIPHGAPSAQRHCTRCAAARAFTPTQNFRVNAQQKRVDVWLIYRCSACDETWNRPIVERGSVSGIGNERFERLQRNDRDLALDYAFNVDDLSNRGINVDADLPFAIQAEGVSNGVGGAAVWITLALERPLGMRLDRLVATALGVSRSRVVSWWRSGALRVVPQRSNALQRPPHDGQVIAVEGDAAVSASRQILRHSGLAPEPTNQSR